MDTLTIWKNINERLSHFVLGKVKDADLTKDIVQDVFLKVFTKYDSIRNKDKIIPWIYQVARNEVVNHFRKNKTITLMNEIEVSSNSDDNLTSELSECLHPMIDSLPEKYRQALIMADIEKIPQKEIAEKLNISYSGAKSRVQRGREMLKSLLEECCTITTDVYGDVLDYRSNKMKKKCDINCD